MENKYTKNIKCKRVTIVFRNLLAICLLIFCGVQVHAKPASLMSASSVVYETADENSNAVGNIVQGNTFELKESITAENGDVWHSITMSNGIQGFVKGEISTAVESSVPVEEESADTENAEETSSEEVSEEESEEGSSVAEELEISQNTKKKTYSIQADINRMREPIQQTSATNEEEELQQTKRISVDKTLILLICVTLLSAALVYFSYTKIKLISALSQKYFYNPRSKKRKMTRKSKKKRTAKEANKWKKSNLQK